MKPVLVLCILLCAASAAPAEKENQPADVSEPQEEMMRMMVKEEEQELPEDLVPELKDAAEFQQVEDPEACFTSCPLGWYLHCGFCYKIFDNRRNWTEAAMDCYNHGAQLASTPSASQYDFLQRLARAANSNFPWLGGIYALNQWIWSDGQRFSYDGWGFSNQVNHTADPCIYLDTRFGFWSSPCSDLNDYICARQAGC